MNAKTKTNYVTQQQLNAVKRGGRGGTGHIHENKEVLDSISQQNVLDWNSAVEKSHEHENKAAIDQITVETLQKLQQIELLAHSHVNKNALDLIWYDQATNTVVIGNSDNPIHFAVFGDVAAGGISSGTGGGGAKYLYQLEDVPDYRREHLGKYLRVKSDGSGVEWSEVQLGESDIPNLSWTKITSGKPTTLSGYGITDAKIQGGTITLGSNTISPVVDELYVHTDNNFTTAYKSLLDLFEYDSANNILSLKDKVVGGKQLSFCAYGDVTAGGISAGTGGGGAKYLYQLEDVPDYRREHLGKYLRVKSDGSGVEWVDVQGGGVISVAGLTGVIEKSALQTALNLGDMAYVDSLNASDIPPLPASKITSGTFADARIASAATWNAKQDAISDLSTIRSRSDEGHTAYNWGNHANAGYAYASSLNSYLPKSGGTVNGAITFGGDDSYGIFTSSDNYCSIGTSSKAFYRAYIHNIYGNTIYENGTSLSSKYAVKSSLGDMAYVDSLNASDIPPLSASKITSGTFADARIASAATWNAKQDAISDLSTIRSRSDEGHAAYNWGNHANAGYATQTYVSNNYHPKGGSTTLDFTTKNLDVHGNIVGTGEVTAGSSSDLRFKNNVSCLRNAGHVLTQLRPVEFDWNNLYSSLGGMNTGHDVGFIAQEVTALIPSAIGRIYEDYLRLDYTKISPYLVSGWQMHETEIERLRKRIAILEKKLEATLK